MDAQTQPIAAPRLNHREARLITFGVLLPLFMGSLDNTILASALPSIGRDFNNVQGLPWLITIYLLAATAGIPLYGKIADIHGRALALRIALAIHMAGSLVCALSPSIAMFIVGRGIQGIGGAGLSAVSVIVLGDIAPPAERGRYYAYFSMVYVTAGACGPAFGGFLSDHLHWSVIFWINVPLGIAAFWITSSLLQRLPRYERPRRLDVIGAILVVTASVSFMLALNLGGRTYPWQSLPVVTLFAAALILGVLFVWRLNTAPEPLIPISILTNPVVAWTVSGNALGWSAIAGLNIFLPMYLQSVIGFSPSTAGLSLMVLMMSLNASAGLAGQLLGRVTHYKRLPMCSLVVAVLSALSLAFWVDRMDLMTFETILFLIGAGFGPTPSMTTVAMQSTIAQHQLGISIGTMNFSRNLFTTMLVALLGVIVLAATPALLTEGAQSGSATFQGSTEAIAAFRHVFLIVAGCLAASLFCVAMIREVPLRRHIMVEGKP
jgi:MFS family permease